MARPAASWLCAIVPWLALCLSALEAEGRTPPEPTLAAPAPALPDGRDKAGCIPQRPLPADGTGRAVIFIGGMGDEISGIMDHLSRYMSATDPACPETRAYYHWTEDLTDEDPMTAARCVARDIAAYRHANPGADVILLGHSLGASTARKTASLLPPGQGRVFLLTLDPVDRATKPERPAAVTWWGNAYVQDSRSARDFIYALGGRWNHCAGADVNLCFRGEDTDEAGYAYIHDNAGSFLLSRGAATGKTKGGTSQVRRPGYSLYDALLQQLAH